MTFDAPYINANPVREEDIDGHLVFRPAGDRKTIGHLLHFHGLGGFRDTEVEFLHRLASGQFQGEPVTTVAPIAQTLAPRDITFNNIHSFYSLARFVGQQSADVQKMLVENLAGHRSVLEKTRNMVQIFGNPPWWYPFVFGPAFDRREAAPITPMADETKRRAGNRGLRPDLDATIKLMFRTTEEIAPLCDAALERVEASPGHICASGFSQGVGLAIILGAVLRPGKYCHLVLACASHVKTLNTPAIRDNEIKLDVILPRGDPVFRAAGFSHAKARRDLQADFRGRSRIWEPPGGHAIEGHVAHIAGMQIVNALRNSRRRRALIA